MKNNKLTIILFIILIILVGVFLVIPKSKVKTIEITKDEYKKSIYSEMEKDFVK